MDPTTQQQPQEVRKKKCEKCNRKIIVGNFQLHFNRCRKNVNRLKEVESSNQGTSKQKEGKKKQEKKPEKTRPELFPCYLCGFSQSLTDLDTHPGKCPNRQINCAYCAEKYPMRIIEDHKEVCSRRPPRPIQAPRPPGSVPPFQPVLNEEAVRRNNPFISSLRNPHQNQRGVLSREEAPVQRRNNPESQQRNNPMSTGPIPRPFPMPNRQIPRMPQPLQENQPRPIQNHSNTSRSNSLSIPALPPLRERNNEPIRLVPNRCLNQQEANGSSFSLQRGGYGRNQANQRQRVQPSTRLNSLPEEQRRIEVRRMLNQFQSISQSNGRSLNISRIIQVEMALMNERNLRQLIQFELRHRAMQNLASRRAPTAQGLQSSQIKKIPEKKYVPKSKEIESCSICCIDFEKNDKLKDLKCKHNFHSQCIGDWLKINRTCPLCKSDLSIDIPSKIEKVKAEIEKSFAQLMEEEE